MQDNILGGKEANILEKLTGLMCRIPESAVKKVL